MPYLSLACQVALVTVFAWSALSKVRSREALANAAKALVTMGLVRRQRARTLVFVLFAVEGACALLLMWRIGPAPYLAALGVVLVLTAGLVLALRRGAATPCPCFAGTTARPAGPADVFRNGLLVIIAGMGAVTATSSLNDGQLGGYAVASAGGLITAFLVVTSTDVVDLFRAESGSLQGEKVGT
jgi:hypothetical protein